MRVTELIEDFPDIEADVFFGGPVQTDTIHYIHTAGDLLDDSVQITNNVYWGGSFEKLKFLILFIFRVTYVFGGSVKYPVQEITPTTLSMVCTCKPC